MSTISRDGVHRMFNAISLTYDRANRIMTLGQDMRWRRQFKRFMPKGKSKLLDMATGTGDQIIALLDHIDSAVGIDLAKDMLSIGKEKLRKHDHVELIYGDALSVPFTDEHFDVVTMSFGIRNVTDTMACLREMHRTLKPGGRTIILEGGITTHSFLRPLHLFYLRHILPRIGALISKHHSAYKYLNETIESYPHGPAFEKMLRDAGFSYAKANPLFFGSVYLYVADK